MNIKRFSLVIALVLLSGLLLTAEKKYPPVPLEELKNPKSPSYVPIPYPQTREEIITDVEYYIKRTGKRTRVGIPSYVNEGSEIDKVLLKLLEKDSGYFIGRIVTVNERTFSREEQNYVMDIHDYSGIVVARLCLAKSGLFRTFAFHFPKFKPFPLMTISEVRNFFTKSSIKKLQNIKIESIEFESFMGGPENPYIKITTKNGVLYMDTLENNVYEIVDSEKFSSYQEFIEKESMKNISVQRIERPFDGALVNSLDNYVTYLKKVE